VCVLLLGELVRLQMVIAQLICLLILKIVVPVARSARSPLALKVQLVLTVFAPSCAILDIPFAMRIQSAKKEMFARKSHFRAARFSLKINVLATI